MRRALVGALWLLAARPAAADLANHAAVEAHADAVAAAAPPEPAARRALYASHLALSAGVLVPVLGTYRLDHACFGDVRPTAIAFDWILGGAVPAGLGIAALAESGGARRALAWTALGLYASTRIGVLVVGNLHVRAYNRRLDLRFAAPDAARGGLAISGRF